MVELLLLIPEVSGSNPVIGEKTKIKKKRPEMALFRKKKKNEIEAADQDLLEPDLLPDPPQTSWASYVYTLPWTWFLHAAVARLHVGDL